MANWKRKRERELKHSTYYVKTGESVRAGGLVDVCERVSVCRTMCTRLKFIASRRTKKVTNKIIFVWWKFITESLLFVWFQFNQCANDEGKKRTEQNGCSDYFPSSQISCIVYFSLRKQSWRARTAHKMAAVHLNYKTFLNKLFSQFTFSNDSMNSKTQALRYMEIMQFIEVEKENENESENKK